MLLGKSGLFIVLFGTKWAFSHAFFLVKKDSFACFLGKVNLFLANHVVKHFGHFRAMGGRIFSHPSHPPRLWAWKKWIDYLGWNKNRDPCNQGSSEDHRGGPGRNSSSRVLEVNQGRGGKSPKGASRVLEVNREQRQGELRTAGAIIESFKKGILPCSVIIIFC